VLQPGQVVLEYLYVSPEDQLPAPAVSGQPSAVSEEGIRDQGLGIREDEDSGQPEAEPTGELIIFCLPWAGELSVAQVPLPALPEGQDFDGWLAEQLGRLYDTGDAEPASDAAPGGSAADGAEPGDARRAQAASALSTTCTHRASGGRDPAKRPRWRADRADHLPGPPAVHDPLRGAAQPGRRAPARQVPRELLHQRDDAQLHRACGDASGALVAGVSFGAGAEAERGEMDALAAQIKAARSRELVRGDMFNTASFCALPGVVDETRDVAAVLGAQPLLDASRPRPRLREANAWQRSGAPGDARVPQRHSAAQRHRALLGARRERDGGWLRWQWMILARRKPRLPLTLRDDGANAKRSRSGPPATRSRLPGCG